MKSFRTFALFFAIVTSSFAQEKKAHIEFGKNSRIISRVFLPDQNLFLITSPMIGGKPDLTVRCFSPTGDETWKKIVPTQFNTMKQKTMAIASPDGNFIYVIQQQDNGYYDEPHYISRFSKAGEEKKFEINGREEFGKNLLKVFCDNNYVYYLASDDGNEKSEKKKATEKLILNRFSKDDFTYKRMVLDLPTIEASDKSTFWSLIGQHGDEKFFASKYIDKEAGKNKFTVVTITSDGKITKTTTFETALSDGKFTRPSYSVFENTWEYEVVQLDYTMKQGAPSQATGMSYSQLIASEGAFGHILYNEAQDCFYTYGFTGPKPFKKLGPEYDGFYVHKFDRNGQPLWKLQHPASDQLMDEKYFRIHGTPTDRDLTITPLLMKGVKVEVSFLQVEYAYNVSADGKATALPKKEGDAIIRGTVTTDKNLKSAAYIEKNQDKRVYMSVFQQSTSELVMKFDDKESTIDLLLFK